MTKRVLVTESVHIDGLSLLKESGFEVVESPNPTQEELKEMIKTFDVIIVRSKTLVNNEIMESGKSLKIVGRAGVGLDNIDLEAAEKHDIKVINIPGVSSESVAELVFALLLSLFRHVPKADKGLKEGVWSRKGLLGKELRGKKIGVVGFGGIGQIVARIAKGFEMNVLCYDVLESSLSKAREMGVEDHGPSKEGLYELLKESDIVTLHVPLLPQTYHLIGEKEIETMKDGAYLINAARGAIIDEEWLYKALKSGKIAGAGLDVYEEEPPTDNPLLKLPNVITTPHIGASTIETQRTISKILAERIIDVLKDV